MMVRSSLALVGALLAAWVGCVPPGPKDEPASVTGGGGAPVSLECRALCEAQHPGGVEAYGALTTCLVCEACHDVCGAELGSSCGAEDLGCSAEASDCATCIASPCAVIQLPDTTFQGKCALAGAACAASTECVALNNCVASCVVSSGPGGGGGGSGGSSSASRS